MSFNFEPKKDGPVFHYDESKDRLYLVAIHHGFLNKKARSCGSNEHSTATLIYPYLDWVDLFTNNEICRKSPKILKSDNQIDKDISTNGSDGKVVILSTICLFSVFSLLTLYSAVMFHKKAKTENELHLANNLDKTTDHQSQNDFNSEHLDYIENNYLGNNYNQENISHESDKNQLQSLIDNP